MNEISGLAKTGQASQGTEHSVIRTDGRTNQCLV